MKCKLFRKNNIRIRTQRILIEQIFTDNIFRTQMTLIRRINTDKTILIF
jgi:hypothetical protein